MRITFQHMFPTINTKTVKLSDCRRVVLYHYHKDEGTVEMRHYAIKAQPVGVSSAVKKILQSRIPNLGELEVRKLALFLFFRAYLVQFIASKYREVLRDCYLWNYSYVKSSMDFGWQIIVPTWHFNILGRCTILGGRRGRFWFRSRRRDFKGMRNCSVLLSTSFRAT